MVSLDELQSTVLGYVGTRWRHQGRSREHGVDCVGLIVCVARDLDLTIEDVRGYARSPDPVQFRRAAARNLTIDTGPLGPGRVVVLHNGEAVAHAGLTVRGDAGLELVHADSTASPMRVVRRPLDPRVDRIRGAFRLPGVAYG